MIAGLIAAVILAIVVVGLVAIAENERVLVITERAILFDFEVEDEGDDIRIGILDLRHYHRNVLFYGPSALALAELDTAYLALLDEIEDLERLGLTGPDAPRPGVIRDLAERYMAEVRPIVADETADPAAFERTLSDGLATIDEMDGLAQEIDNMGERLATESLARVDAATTGERFLLIALVVGVVVVGVALAIAAARVLSQLRAAFAREHDAARRLALVLRTRTDFIADASHELRTPLTVIRGNADIGLGAEEPRIHRSALREISTEAARMGRLVDDLFFLARADAGAPPLEREVCSARWLLDRVARRAEVLANERGACLMLAPGGDALVEADPARFEQAILILVDNAAKHAPDGTCVGVVARVESDVWAVDVIDEGPGIPPEELPLIFERFYQAGDRRARKHDGTGLGLSIARTIVEGHGGTIAAENRPGAGTRMTVSLPLTTSAAESELEVATDGVEEERRADELVGRAT